MSIQDMIKKSVLEADNFSNAVNLGTFITIIINMSVAVLAGYLIFRIYRRYYNGVIYSRTYGLTLVGMTILTCMVTLAISTNIVISLGMVGALSIVRYRTAIKEPLDLLYMFWAITSGITIGANMYVLVGIGFLVMYLFISVTFGKKTVANTYIMMVRYEGDDNISDNILREFNNMKNTVKSKLYRNGTYEMTVEVTCKEAQLNFVERVERIVGVTQVSFVKYNGEYHG